MHLDVPWSVDDVPCTDVPWTMDHVENLASFAREVAEQEQGEFLNQRGFCGRKGFEMDRCTFSCTMYRCTMTHSRLTAVRPAGKSCAFVQTALRPSAVLYHVFDNVRFAHVFGGIAEGRTAVGRSVSHFR